MMIYRFSLLRIIFVRSSGKYFVERVGGTLNTFTLRGMMLSEFWGHDTSDPLVGQE